MRLIQVRVADESRESVLDVLDDANADFVIADEAAGNDSSIVYFPIPSGAVEEMLDRLREAGLDDNAFTIVTKIETATTPHFDELEGRYTQGPEDEIGLSHAELRTKAQELTPETPMFVVFAALSAVLATAGLLLNSAIVITGAMVVAPFAGSSLSTSVGIVSNDLTSATKSVRSQLLGLSIAIVSATGASLIFKWGYLVPPTLVVGRIEQVASFTSPTLLTFTIAIVAGTAGALALSTDLPVAIAGVAVAAAIVPAAAAVGVGVVWNQLPLALGAFALLLVNVVFINLTALIALLAFGYRPSDLGEFSNELSLSLRTVVGAVVTVAVVILVAGVLFSTYQYVLFDQTVNRNVNDVLSESEYAGLELVEVQTDYNGASLFGQEGTATVVVSRTSEKTYPKLSETLQQQIATDTNRAVTVKVRFIEYQQSEPRNPRSNHPGRKTLMMATTIPARPIRIPAIYHR